MTEQIQIAPILDGHLDPVNDVHNALIASNHANPESWLNEVHNFYPQAAELGSSGQYRRSLVNRVLHIVLGSTKHQKSDYYRYLLIDEGSHEQWLEIIQNHVAPFLAQVSQENKQ